MKSADTLPASRGFARARLVDAPISGIVEVFQHARGRRGPDPALGRRGRSGDTRVHRPSGGRGVARTARPSTPGSRAFRNCARRSAATTLVISASRRVRTTTCVVRFGHAGDPACGAGRRRRGRRMHLSLARLAEHRRRDGNRGATRRCRSASIFPKTAGRSIREAGGRDHAENAGDLHQHAVQSDRLGCGHRETLAASSTSPAAAWPLDHRRRDLCAPSGMARGTAPRPSSTSRRRTTGSSTSTRFRRTGR
jgi:hypothetical protein